MQPNKSAGKLKKREKVFFNKRNRVCPVIETHPLSEKLKTTTSQISEKRTLKKLPLLSKNSLSLAVEEKKVYIT